MSNQNNTLGITCDDELMNMLILLSHIVIGTILVICLKTSRPIMLTLLLSLIVGFICYIIQESIPYYVIPAMGLAIYAIELTTNTMSQSQSISKPTYLTIITTLWKIPFWSIICYYVILVSQSIIKKN